MSTFFEEKTFKQKSKNMDPISLIPSTFRISTPSRLNLTTIRIPISIISREKQKLLNQHARRKSSRRYLQRRNKGRLLRRWLLLVKKTQFQQMSVSTSMTRKNQGKKEKHKENEGKRSIWRSRNSRSYWKRIWFRRKRRRWSPIFLRIGS